MPPPGAVAMAPPPRPPSPPPAGIWADASAGAPSIPPMVTIIWESVSMVAVSMPSLRSAVERMTSPNARASPEIYT